MAKKNQTSSSDETTTSENMPIGDNAGSRLMGFVERIERLEEERKGLGDDVKDIYAEAKGIGFDTKIIRKVINRRKMTKDKRQEEDHLLDTYECALENLNNMME